MTGILSVLIGMASVAGGVPGTLEDIYGDTGETFQAAIGFINMEGTVGQGAAPSYGLAVDDVVISWREFALEQDDSECDVEGSCAVIELATNNVYEGQTMLTLLLMELSPPVENDCDLDDTPDGTSDCNGNGTPDLVVRATSAAELEGEIVFVDRIGEPGSSHYRGRMSISTFTDSPGVLFIQQMGPIQPSVTVTYFDEDDGSGNPCPNNVDPAMHGYVRASTLVFLGSTCEVAFFDARTVDNGDGDIFVDTGETVDMQLSYMNNCGFDLHGCAAYISSDDPKVDCIVDSMIDLGDVAADGGIVLSADAFRWKLADGVNRTDLAESLSASFDVTVSCDELDALVAPQIVRVALDIDVDVDGQTPLAWTEGFESATLGKFEAENLDMIFNSQSVPELWALAEGWRCQYSDPAVSGQGDPFNPEGWPGETPAAADAIFWQVDGPGLTSCDSGRAKSGDYSMYYGTCLAGEDVFTTPLAVVESVRTTDPINLGVGSEGRTGTDLQLSWWHQISLLDGKFLGIDPGQSTDRGVVQIKTVDAAGNDTSVWTNLTPFQNGYDGVAYDDFFNFTFDPIDDGSTEDDLFDPTNPVPRHGPSSTCAPTPVFVWQGDTDDPFDPDNAGSATTLPDPGDVPDLGVGTWVESRVDLTPWRGQRIKLRFLVSSIKASRETHEEQFSFMNGQWFDDGWWIDDVRIDETLTDPAAVLPDGKQLLGCAGDPDVGCIVAQDCVDSGTTGPCDQPTPGCGAPCGAISVAVSTVPDATGGPEDEALVAPGRPIEISAEDSSGRCVDGPLQFRFSIDGGPVLREWGENPVFVDAPLEDRDYVVDVRCSTDASCNNSTTVDVDVHCPSTGSLRAAFGGTILAQAGKTEWSWTTARDFVLWTGSLAQVASYAGDETAGSGTSFDDPTLPSGTGSGFYYLVRTQGEFCNDRGLWTSGGPEESPLRENNLP